MISFVPINKKPIVALILLFFWAQPVFSQYLQVQSLTIADGLSQGFVTSIFEDSRGFIWIGTLQGLNRYDGYQVKRFVLDNQNKWALKASYIHAITEDKNGLLWIGTDKGPVILDPYTERFVLLSDIISDLPNQPSITITENKGNIWVVSEKSGKDGLYVVRPPAQLTKMIRDGQLRSSAFSVRFLKLNAEHIAFRSKLFRINDSIITGIDEQGRLYKIDPNSLQIRETDARTLNFEPIGASGFYYPQDKSRGQIIIPSGNNLPEILWPHWLKGAYMKLPNGKRVFFRTADPNLYKLPPEVPGQYELNLNDSEPVLNLEQLVRLDKVCSESCLIDRNGNMWVGTTGYGVRKISEPLLKYRQILPNQSIYNFVMLPDGRIWPGIYKTLEVFNPKNGAYEVAPWTLAQPNTWGYSLLISKDETWWMACRTRQELFITKKAPGSSNWQKLKVQLNILEDIPVQLLEDKQGFIWMSGNEGQIVRIHPETNQVDTWNVQGYFPKDITAPMRSNCLIETVDGCLWAGTSRGLIQIKNYDRPTPVFNVFFNRPKAPVSFNNECILSVYPDPQHPHILWLGTRGGGLNRFDSKTGSSDFYTQKDGLPDNVVYGILPDDNGRMWLSTNRGLSIFDPSSKRFLTVASDPNAPLNTEFNTCAYQRLPGGELAFGSTQGLFILKPEILQKTGLPGVVAITNIKINGIEIDPTATDSRISRSPLNIIKLDLPHSENNLQLEFAALQTNNPTSVQYRYRLTGLHKKNWIDIARQRSINLAAIPPGAYVLELQCSVPGLGWDVAPSTSLMLTIHPPWYRSPWSYLVYGLLSVALLYFSLGYYRRRLQLQHAVALGEKEMERLKSLDDFKTRFFSYIAHEFKTPLTLILGMARRLDKNANTTQQNDYAGKIVEQGQNMLELVNQILDISKLNHQEIQLNMQLGYISAYMHYLVESLRPLAEFQKIRLLFETSAPKLLLDFDPARLKYIAHNLIGNAIRHTPEGGTIRVAIHSDTAEQVQLSVSDTGRGIHPKDLPHIFDRYYQGKTGRQEQYHFGLGLAFVKDMVHLLGGAIEVNSALEAGTTFTITLPVSQTASKMEQPLPENNAKAASTKQPNKTKYKQPGLPSLLVVEDNPAISEYIDLCLEPYFQLTFTNNGEQGLEYALENIPDLILTDVMMPGMDGHELTRQLKSHVLTCHIPIVLLSAKSEIADRLAGQSLGANAYVAKPFDETELVLILKNLHQLQQEWRKRNAMIAASDDPVGQLEKETEQQTSEAAQITHSFLLNIFAHFEKNYTDDTYDLPQLCKDLNMSKSQLQRKLAAVSNQSAMVLLRQFRLQKAYHLLENNPHYNVKEICFEVGFKDPAHFSRSFSKMFQRTPSSFKS